MVKKITALILSIIMVCSVVVIPAGAEECMSQSINQYHGDSTLQPQNSFSKQLMSMASESLENEDSVLIDGFSIANVTVDGNLVTVGYTAAFDCTVLVGIYNDDGVMVTSGKTTVSPSEDISSVTISIDNMPEYFVLKVFMMDDLHNPLCDYFSTTEYTKGIQDIKNSVIDDYDPDLVINLDESEETNFIVCNPDVIRIDQKENINIPEDTNPDNGVYVFNNCDEILKTIKKGDLLSYIYEEDIILIDVKKIDIENDKVIMVCPTKVS